MIFFIHSPYCGEVHNLVIIFCLILRFSFYASIVPNQHITQHSELYKYIHGDGSKKMRLLLYCSFNVQSYTNYVY